MISNLILDIKKSQNKYDCVIGIMRGGLYISKPVANALNLPHKKIHISHYDNQCVLEVDDVSEYKNPLVVDDLIDSGKTIDTYKSKFGNGDVAVLFWKESNQQPEFYIKEKPPGWVVFPWENNG